MTLAGATAYVTGASSGIGKATAIELHRRGAAVGLIARRADALHALAGTLGSRAAVAIADVTVRAEVEAAVQELEAAIGPPDVLVNNAGLGAYASVLEEHDDTFEHLMAVNYLGTVYATRAVLGGMAARGRGHIVNVASVAGRVGAPFEAAYSASKFAVVGFSESLAAEMGELGVAVSLVNPGPVATGFTDARGVPFQRKVPRPRRPEEIAAAVVRAIEHGVFEQTIPRWLRVGAVVRAVAPGAYRKGLLRDARRESAALAARRTRPGE